ncbi:MAG: hypothetical protein EOO27_44415 [Comamonadaceae bacterium]|nr:MAG: hypothetical protein EOO27_44415 [Comamonadaceae bacterium]
MIHPNAQKTPWGIATGCKATSGTQLHAVAGRNTPCGHRSACGLASRVNACSSGLTAQQRAAALNSHSTCQPLPVKPRRREL